MVAARDTDGALENVTQDSVRDLITMINDGELSSRGAKDTLLELYKNGGNTREIAESNNWIQQNDEQGMKDLVQKIVDENPDQFTQFKAGEEKLIAFFVGQAMKQSQGQANPQIVTKLIKEM